MKLNAKKLFSPMGMPIALNIMELFLEKEGSLQQMESVNT
jgi:hypothetical protein